jgi:hypothetical protein
MRLRNGKQYLTTLETAIICKEAEEKKLNEMAKIHIPKLKELLYVSNTNKITSDKKAMLVCEIYEYVYNIFGEFVALQHIHPYSNILKIILKKIPVLTQQLIEVINRNNKENILDYNIIKPYLQCIKQLSKVERISIKYRKGDAFFE